MYVCMYVCICVCMHVCVCMCVCMYVLCMFNHYVLPVALLSCEEV